jgi:hypothetical protein
MVRGAALEFSVESSWAGTNQHGPSRQLSVRHAAAPPVQVHLGSYYLYPTDTDTYANQVQELNCTRSVPHPNWSYITTQNDIALCFLDGRANFQPVSLATGACVGFARSRHLPTQIKAGHQHHLLLIIYLVHFWENTYACQMLLAALPTIMHALDIMLLFLNITTATYSRMIRPGSFIHRPFVHQMNTYCHPAGCRS